MISHKHKFMFTHINKCAGMSIRNALRSYSTEPLGHETLQESIKKCRGDHREYFKFTFVRNPWDKMVSFYHYHYKREWDFDSWPWDKNNPPEFKGFIKQIYDESFDWETIWMGRGGKSTYDQKIPLRVSNSHAWLVDENDKLLADFIGRFENLQEDFNTICDKIGIPQKELPHRNKSSRKHYSEYYDDETRDIVAEKYAKDIKYFGYEFGGQE